MHNRSRRIGIYLTSFSMLVTIYVLIWMPTTSVKADAGFTRFMHFFLEYEIPPVSVVSGNVIGCSDAACSTGHDLGFGCGTESCTADKYSGWESYTYYKLVITFTDKTRESNIFSRKGYEPFIVTVKDDGLMVREPSYQFYPNRDRGAAFGVALPLTLFVELIVAAIFIKVTKMPKIILASVFFGNIITLPVVWFIIPLFTLDTIVLVTLAELFAVTFEALFLYFTNKTKLSFIQASILSLLMNGLSFYVGELLNRIHFHIF